MHTIFNWLNATSNTIELVPIQTTRLLTAYNTTWYCSIEGVAF